MSLWYFETVSPLGRWSPNTQAERPQTATHGGHERLHNVSGYGPRIRRVVEVPAGIADLPLNDLRRHLWGDDSEAAVSPAASEVAQ